MAVCKCFIDHYIRSGYPVSQLERFMNNTLRKPNRFWRESWFLWREENQSTQRKPLESDWDQPIAAHAVWAQDQTQLTVVGGADENHHAN